MPGSARLTMVPSSTATMMPRMITSIAHALGLRQAVGWRGHPAVRPAVNCPRNWAALNKREVGIGGPLSRRQGGPCRRGTTAIGGTPRRICTEAVVQVEAARQPRRAVALALLRLRLRHQHVDKPPGLRSMGHRNRAAARSHQGRVGCCGGPRRRQVDAAALLVPGAPGCIGERHPRDRTGAACDCDRHIPHVARNTPESHKRIPVAVAPANLPQHLSAATAIALRCR